MRGCGRGSSARGGCCGGCFCRCGPPSVVRVTPRNWRDSAVSSAERVPPTAGARRLAPPARPAPRAGTGAGGPPRRRLRPAARRRRPRPGPGDPAQRRPGARHRPPPAAGDPRRPGPRPRVRLECERAITPGDLPSGADLIVAADGVRSELRTRHSAHCCPTSRPSCTTGSTGRPGGRAAGAAAPVQAPARLEGRADRARAGAGLPGIASESFGEFLFTIYGE